jgi:acyl carrier protein
MPSTLERVQRVTAELLKVEPGRVKVQSKFVDDLGAESVQSIELVAAFEEEFGIEMNEDEALAVKTVGDAAAFIDRVLARS